MSSYAIDLICKTSRISSYLAERGINPNRESLDRKVYLCPLPGHGTDTHPSFYIFDKGDHEDYWCFGCKSGGGIIQFISQFENISIRETIQRLSKKLNLDVDNEIDYLVSRVREIIVVAGQDVVNDSLMIATQIGRLCHDHMKKCDFDPVEVEICEKFFKVVDRLMMNRDVIELQNASEYLLDKLGVRFNAYMDEKDKKELDSYRSWKL